ncbi:pitrilysin family protein [Cytophagaceae bacterium ABcell3]|nr:pitrilysin family protein [Cytophagaceae bacterium ABcell3]
MINYKEFTLDNGLRVLVHEDPSTPIAVVNILYNVGSRDEDEQKTGFAHLFEHLMFGGSANIPSYDEPLQKVGGENNAFTSPDITNYYLTLPAVNLETAFWLESDRMMSLSFDPHVLEVQRSVVIEEFKQRYLNQPYGDAWLRLRPLAYKVHPYQWATIGKEISHIENATMEDVKSFFHKYYIPNNAIMVVAGGVKFEEVQRLSKKWFGPIEAGEPYNRSIPQEPTQKELRHEEVHTDVPLNALFLAYHAPGKMSDLYQTSDLLSDVLGRGKSSRLYKQLVDKKNVFNSINAYTTGSLDPSLLVISGKLNKGVSCEDGAGEINAVIDNLLKEGVEENELQKVKNQAEASLVFEEVEVLHRAMNLAVATLMGDPDLVNQERGKIEKVSTDGILSLAKKTLIDNNCSRLFYKSK